MCAIKGTSGHTITVMIAVPAHTTKAYGGVDKQLHSFLMSAPHGGSWSVLLYLWRKIPLSPTNRRLCVSRGLYGHFRIEKNRLPRGAQISGARSPLQPHFVWWCLIFVGPQYGICFMSPYWLTPTILRWLLDFGKLVDTDQSLLQVCS
jgi:hypothetical protein